MTSIASNRQLHVAPDGSYQVVLEDRDEAGLRAIESAWRACRLSRELLDRPLGQRLKNISSLAFCGADRRSAVLGCMQGDCLYCLSLPVAGLAPIHWNYH